jgi:predicted nucleic-acid-binding Zn-ribbon protein
MKKQYKQFCPKCRSTQVTRDKYFLYDASGQPAHYVCQNCGYSGTFFPETSQTMPVKKVKKVPSKVDFSYGRFEVGVIWKITGPLTVLFAIIALTTGEKVAGTLLFVGGALTCYFAYKTRIRPGKDE